MITDARDSGYTHISIEPNPDQPPASRLSPYPNTIGIPVVELTAHPYRGELSFNPADPEGSIRYLRQLAAVATDLADQVQDKVAGAVLEG